MVLQREQQNLVWGWAEPGESVTVRIDGQHHKTTASESGDWRVWLEPLAVGGPYEMVIKGKNTLRFSDILSGEVWLCSGQSNMEWTLEKSNHAAVEIASAAYPEIRLITVPRVGSQTQQKDFVGQWEQCGPDTVKNFSAIGYFYGRTIHKALGVPVGLIDNAWGGSAAEAWIRRDVLEADEAYGPLLKRWDELAATYDVEVERSKFETELQAWESNGKRGTKPRWRGNRLEGQHRPANLYNGVLHPTIGYGIKGVIWYQGETNARAAYQYRDLFPLLIKSWREEWGIGDFSFYYVQLADFRKESAEPQESEWAELREAQTMTMSRLPNVGQAVAIDLGEGRDIHPRRKQDVGARLASWALARDYGYDLPYRSPEFASVKMDSGRALLDFEHVGKGLYSFDTTAPTGFAIAGEDRKFVWADAKIVDKDTVSVWSDAVPDPVAVRYAWGDNPDCNLYSREGLPATPFRTDDWPGLTNGRD